MKRNSSRRRTGGVDVVDVVVGIALAGILPFVCLVGVESFSDGDLELGKSRQEPLVVPPDDQEIEQYVRQASILLNVNVKNGFIPYIDLVDDQFLKEDYRRWARLCLDNCISKLDELESMIDLHPNGPDEFRHRLIEADKIRNEAEELRRRVSRRDS